MNYRIQELEAFSIIGQEIELTNSKKKYLEISTRFWSQFNVNLKKSSLSQSGNWIKYAFMIRDEGKLFYYCAIPKRTINAETFIEKEIEAHRYLVVEHVGKMDTIYRTYDKIYDEILPNSNYITIKDEFIHFEKYDYRFHWNRDDSVIEIWIPIQ